jgi:hypothetical protein
MSTKNPEVLPEEGGLEAGASDRNDPDVDYQPESGQPGPREPLSELERDEDDDL